MVRVGLGLIVVGLVVGGGLVFDLLWGDLYDYVGPAEVLLDPAVSALSLLGVVLVLGLRGLRLASALVGSWTLPAPWLASPVPRFGEAVERVDRQEGGAGERSDGLGWPHALPREGFALVCGAERWPTAELLQFAAQAGRPTLHAQPAAPWTEAELTRRLERLPSAPVDRAAPLIVIEGADALGRWAVGERPEARIARFLEVCRRPLERCGAQVVVVEPLPAERLLSGEPACKRLSAQLSHRLLWDGQALRAQGSASGGLAWWLANLGDPVLDSPAGLRWSGRVGLGLSVLALLLLSVAICVPGLRMEGSDPLLLGDGRGALPGSLWANDAVLGWMKGDGGLLETTRIFWPSGANLVALFGNLLPSFFAAPLQGLLGYPGYWNVFVICVLVLNGLSARWLARVVGADQTGALLAGLAFTAAPPVLREISDGSQIQFVAFPLAVAIGLCLRAMERGGRTGGVIAGLAITFAALSWWFYGAFVFFILGFVCLDRWRKVPDERPALRDFGGALARVLVPMTLFAGPLVASANRGDIPGLGWLTLSTTNQASMIDGFLAEVELQGATSMRAFIGGNGVVGAGIFACLAALLPFGLWLALPEGRRRLWVFIGGVAAALSFGPVIELGGERYHAPLGVLQAILPFGARLGAPDRLMILAAVAGSVLLGLCLRPLQRRSPRPLRGAVPVLALLLAPSLGLWSGDLPLRTFTFSPPRWLEQIGEPGAIAELPIGWSEQLAIYEPLRGRDSLIGGPGVVRQLHAFTEFRELLDVDPALSFFRNSSSQIRSVDALVELRSRGFRYVAVNNRLLRALVGSDGDNPDVQTALQVSQRVDEVLGPPVLRGPEVTVYRLPDGRR